MSCNDNLTAHTVRRIAVATMSDCATRSSCSETSGICRGSDVSDAGNSGFYICDYFVHPDNEDDVLRTVNETGNAVTVTVDID